MNKHESLTVMDFWTNDAMTGNKTFFFYSLIAISSQNLQWLDHKFQHGGAKI